MSKDDLFLRIYGDPVLRQRCPDVTTFGPELQAIAERMFEVMYEEEGVGLAAPQVGVSMRMLVLDVPVEDGEDFRGVLINPTFSNPRGEQKGTEGCLSFPGLRETVTRHDLIDVKALDIHGEPIEFSCHDLLSRAVQHELDHLNGILFIDHMSPVRRRLLSKRLKKISEEGREAAV